MVGRFEGRVGVGRKCCCRELRVDSRVMAVAGICYLFARLFKMLKIIQIPLHECFMLNAEECRHALFTAIPNIIHLFN